MSKFRRAISCLAAYGPSFDGRGLLWVLGAAIFVVLGPTIRARATAEYDPRTMTRVEVQIIQEAFIFTGFYVGLKDGAWGPRTMEAAQSWRRRNNLRASITFSESELSLLLQQLFQTRLDFGWKVETDSHTGASIGYPSRLISQAGRSGPINGVSISRFSSPDGTIRLSIIRSIVSADVMRAVFERYVSEPDIIEITYRLDRADRLVASVDRRNGTTSYFRMDYYNAEWRGLAITVDRKRQDVTALITAVSTDFSASGRSVIDGTVDTDIPTIGPVLERIGNVNKPPAGREPSLPSSQDRPSGAGLRAKSSGTAFAVRKDGYLLTNNHVVHGCSRIVLGDQTEAIIVRADGKRDLALLKVPRQFLTTIRFRRDPTVELGESVSLFGYPHYGAVSTSINLTAGIVTSTRGIGDNPMHFQVNAAMQPGNSGGPVLDEAGLAIGVAVARLSDRVVMAETGTVPQTMNYAIRGQVVDSFLIENGILVEKSRPAGKTDLRSVAKEVEPTVLPVLCMR